MTTAWQQSRDGLWIFLPASTAKTRSLVSAGQRKQQEPYSSSSFRTVHHHLAPLLWIRSLLEPWPAIGRRPDVSTKNFPLLSEANARYIDRLNLSWNRFDNPLLFLTRGCRLISYKSIGFEQLYNFGFGSVSIGLSAGPQTDENGPADRCGSADFRPPGGRTLGRIEVDSKDFWLSGLRAIDWCAFQWNWSKCQRDMASQRES